MNDDNVSKFQQLVSGEDVRWVEKAKWRKEHKDWLKKSALIALTILRKLRDIGMSQKDLAEQLNVSAQQVSKILKGRENLTLETISKLEGVLGIELASVPQYITTDTKDFEVVVSQEAWIGQPIVTFKKQERHFYDYDAMVPVVSNPIQEDLTVA